MNSPSPLPANLRIPVINRTPLSTRELGLATWLATGSIVIVLLAVTAMSLACALLVNRLVDQQALTRVQLAATQAREALRRVSEDTLTDAHVLAERPTLQRMLAEQDETGLQPFLARFCESSQDTACAVLAADGTLHATDSTLAWAQVRTALREQGERFLIAPRDGSPPLWGSAAAVAGDGGWRAVVIRRGSAELLGTIGHDVGARVSLENFATYLAPDSDPLTGLHSAALANSGLRAARVPGSNDFAASLAIAAPTGEVIALLDARLSGAEFSGSLQRFRGVLIVIALLIAAVAGILGLYYGRYLAAPVVALRDVSERMGRGDLIASVPPLPTRELGSLSRSMDEMRVNLLDLTQSLRQREAEAQALLGGIVEGVYAVDAERRIRYVNPQMARLLRRSPDELHGQFCGDALNPLPVQGRRPCEFDCPILQARSQPQASSRELLCLADDNRRSTIIVSAPPVGGLQVQVVRDETDLEAARRARDSVLGNISHEFRTPLAAQLASIELLRDGLATLPPDAHEELLGNVERGVLRLMRLIDNLLESVRIEAGQLGIRDQQVDLTDVIGEAQALLQPLLIQRQLTLAVELDALDAPVRGDSQRLLQVFVNLISNAIKYAPDHSKIRVDGRVLARDVEVWVEDEGPGVAAENSDAIFERFRRAGASAEPDAPGLGLGLWIVKSIVERHHGTIHVTRTDASRTRFVLTLPRDHSA